MKQLTVVLRSCLLAVIRVEHWCQAFWCAPYEAMGCPPAVTGCCNRREVRGNFLEDNDESVALCCCLGYCCCGRQAKRRRLGRFVMHLKSLPPEQYEKLLGAVALMQACQSLFLGLFK